MKYSIPEYGIEVEVHPTGGGHMTSKLSKELKDGADDVIGQAAADAIESLLLAHACAGVDITESKYLTGFRTAIESIANNL